MKKKITPMTNNLIKNFRFFSLLCLLIITSSIGFVEQGTAHTNYSEALKPQAPAPRNVILMIGDGMGYEQLKLARWVEQGKQGILTMDTLPHFFNVSTSNLDNLLTDSAAGGTAIATGSKTENYRISQCNDGRNLTSILEIAQQLGKATGIVTTTTINHATPATFASHEKSRNNYASILDQLVDSSVDVLMGGGKNDMTTDVISKIRANGYTIAYDKTEMTAASGKTWGIFGDGHMDYESGRDFTNIPSIKEMTEKTLELLSSNVNGFFLVVEGGRIDHAGHGNNLVDQALETIAFDKAIASALDFVINDGNTLLLVTADHETGGMAIVGDSLDQPLPGTFTSETDKRAARISRANQISATWSTGYHTDQDIPLFGYGPIPAGLTNNTVVENTVAFNMMKEFIDPDNIATASLSCTRVISDVKYWTTGVKVGDQARYIMTKFSADGIPRAQIRYAINGTTELIIIREGDEYLDRIISINETVIMYQTTLYSISKQKTYLMDPQPIFRDRLEMSYSTAWPFYPIHTYDLNAATWVFPPRVISTNATLLEAMFGYHPDDYTLSFTENEIILSGRWLGLDYSTFIYNKITGFQISIEWGNNNGEVYGLWEFIDSNERTTFPIIDQPSDNDTNRSDADDSPVLWGYSLLSIFIIYPILRKKKNKL